MATLVERLNDLIEEVEGLESDERRLPENRYQLLCSELSATRKAVTDLRYDMDDMRKELREAAALFKALRRKELGTE